MLKPHRRSRRRALRGIGAGIASVFLLGFRSLADRLSAVAPPHRRTVIPADAVGEVIFVDDVIVRRGPGGVTAFSARCPHLGCRISREMEGLLVCPCHGSRFHMDGTVATGPAARPLETLHHSIDAAGRIIVEL